MIRTLSTMAVAATLLVACGQPDNTNAEVSDTTNGPVVSAPAAPGNAAVDTTPTTGDMGTTAGANSFTEAQAKGAIETAGYTEVSELTQGEDGVWTGRAMKDGKAASVTVDYKGSVKAL
jgi:major membrane immunogen (membrane-anchored lipoprotein)